MRGLLSQRWWWWWWWWKIKNKKKEDNSVTSKWIVDRAMTQAVSRRTLTVESRVRSRLSMWDLRWTKLQYDWVFYELFGLPCHYYSTVALRTRMSSRVGTKGLLVAQFRDTASRHRHVCTTTAAARDMWAPRTG
jgi:hypothetical protein